MMQRLTTRCSDRTLSSRRRLIGALLITACSGVGVTAPWASTEMPQSPTVDVRVVRDLAYNAAPDADDAKHRLDLYLPDVPGPAPVLMWIHGGAWALGDRSGEEAIARRFAEQGIVVAAISHRLSPGRTT